ncbi:hypothetical protein COO91_08534 [Nostoc flagelliforme CCNUN1]|uniref:Uncharacterized protein n=1 Tax=Nostoc flagelliforme CCNUN1 TaxID=2038116 RepID=A0A2K8T3V8_9NOSO|nr:hypothetical protein COO91_08534 [Nostoc flagelliforme CCNUN1]
MYNLFLHDALRTLREAKGERNDKLCFYTFGMLLSYLFY